MNSVNVSENIDNEGKAACNVKNIEIEDNLEQKVKNIDEKNLNSSVEHIDILKNPSSNLESMDIEESLANKFKNIDIEDILTSSIEIIDEENPPSNLENINIEETVVNKLENIDIEDILTSSIIIIDEENLASNLEKSNIEETLANKLKNVDIEEILTSSIEIIDEESPASNEENVDSEDNWVDIEENCDSEGTNGLEIRSTCMEDLDVQRKIERLFTTVSSFREDFESSLHKLIDIKELFQSSCLNQDYLSSENAQMIMALMQKIDNSICVIKFELSYWDRIDDFTPKEMLTLIKNPALDNRKNRFPQIYSELSKVMKYLRKIEELEKNV